MLRIGIFCVLSLLGTWAEADKSLKPPGYAIASEHPLATQAGLKILAQGGNAFDAAITVASVLAVVAPYHSGLGGGGFWLLHQAKDNSNIFVDAREKAPLAAQATMFLDAKGQIIPGLSLNGGLAAAIPGEPAALVYLAEHYGQLPLSQTLAPAIQLAKEGFIVDPQFWFFSNMNDRLKQLSRFPETAKIFLHQGRSYQIGEKLIQSDLANTLEAIVKEGHPGFYQGKVAFALVKGVQAAGGIWSLQDLQNYQVVVRQPLQGKFHNMVVITAPPPSAGGIGLLTMLNILADYPLSSMSKAVWVHYLIEAMRLAYWQRGQYLADPDFVQIPVTKLLSQENARALGKQINPDKATNSSSLPPATAPQTKSANTTHFSILDSEGNRVAATLSVNYIFGSSVVPGGTGVLLNDEMDDFSAKPGINNVFGLVGSEKNSIVPGKRPLSNMMPTFLEMPGRVAIFGTPGGGRIPTMMLIASLGFERGAGAISMVSAMRFHHQYLPDWLQFEPDTLSAEVQEQLKNMGYQLVGLHEYYGDMQALTWDQKSDLITATSDPRHIGLAVVISNKKTGYGLKY